MKTAQSLRVRCSVMATWRRPRQRFDFQEDFRHAIAHILVVDDLTAPRGRRQGGVDFAHQLLVGFVHADQRELRVVGRVVNIEHIFHAHDKGGAAIGRDFPVFAQVRLKLVFFSARWTLMVETFGAIFSSTTFSASRRTVHRARPAGAGEHAKAVNRASKGAVEGKLGRFGSGFALQRGFDSFFHESLFEMFNGAGADAQRFGHVGYFPRAAHAGRHRTATTPAHG